MVVGMFVCVTLGCGVSVGATVEDREGIAVNVAGIDVTVNVDVAVGSDVLVHVGVSVLDGICVGGCVTVGVGRAGVWLHTAQKPTSTASRVKPNSRIRLRLFRFIWLCFPFVISCHIPTRPHV